MPTSGFPFRCLVFLLLAAAGFLARPAEAARRPFADIVAAAAERHGVDPDLVHAVIAVESGYRATAQSPAGAQGLMQLMPGTQRDLGVSDAFDPRQNVDAGVAYLRRLTDEFGTVLALAAYNAGPGAVRRYNGIPPYGQTRAYVQAVLDRGRPAADAPATEEHDPSEDPAHALSETGLAEGPRADLRLQDSHRATDAAAGLGPLALDAAADPDDRTRVAALPDQLLYGMDRPTVDADLRRNGPGLPVLAAMRAASDLGVPTPSGSAQSAAVVDSPPSGRELSVFGNDTIVSLNLDPSYLDYLGRRKERTLATDGRIYNPVYAPFPVGASGTWVP